jgi:hypothetical protein
MAMLNNQRVPSLEQAANDGLDRFRADLGAASSATVDACIVDPELSFMGQAAQRRSHGPMGLVFQSWTNSQMPMNHGTCFKGVLMIFHF